MPPVLILATASETRLALLRNAGLEVTDHPARLDESAIQSAMALEGLPPRDMADTLAEMKARKISLRHPDAVVIGADQVLELDGQSLGPCTDPDGIRDRLRTLANRTHLLHSAAVVYSDGAPQWRATATARLTMRDLSETWIDAYLSRNVDSLTGSTGGYLIEAEGVRLFSALEGDWFTILGLPLVPLLLYLGQRGYIPQ